jgi:hypothetical protein
LRLSYESEPGDKLSDLGGGKILIRNPARPDRVLDRATGEIIERPYSEWDNLGRDVLRTLALFVVLASALGLVFWWTSG